MLIRKVAVFILLATSCFSLLYGLVPFLNQTASTCANGQPPHVGMENSTHASLRKLAALENYCKGAVTSQMMLFTPMPKTPAEVNEFAAGIAYDLQEFNRFSIIPLVVFEPDLQTPDIMQQLATGSYDSTLESYYAEIKQFGVSDKQMGTWVILPEANTPTWRITDPELFTRNVTKIATLHKKYFSDSNISLLLDAYTYPNEDIAWTSGSIVSLKPYTDNLPDGLIDTIGLQGFPRKSPKNEPGEENRMAPDTFLPVQLLHEVANSLGVSSVWINTGTFHTMYTNDSAAQVELTHKERREILDDILSQAESLTNDNMTVTINIFAENKSFTSEHVDWSYPEITHPRLSYDDLALKPFLTSAHQKRFSVSFYDH